MMSFFSDLRLVLVCGTNYAWCCTVVRGTLRYQGFPEFVRALVEMVWREVARVLVGAEDAREGYVPSINCWIRIILLIVLPSPSYASTLFACIKAICKFPSEAESAHHLRAALDRDVSDEKVEVRGGNLLDMLCARQERLMKYEEGERDLVMLQHKFVVEWADGSEVRCFPSLFISIYI
jgi:hypothetical protein